MARKQSNKTLYVLLALLAVVVLAMYLLPSEAEINAAQQATQTEAVAEADSEEELALAATIAKAGSEAPDFTVEMVDGRTITLSELRGKVVLVNFWATWCPPCREELKRVQADLIDRFAGRDFLFLPISRGEERAVVERFLTKMEYTFPVGLDTDQSIYNRYASNYIPRNFLVGRDGKVVVAETGYEPEQFEALLQYIEKTLE